MILKPRYLSRGAYRFVRASNHYQVTGAMAVPAPPMSMLVRFKFASTPADGAEYRIVSIGSSTAVATTWLGLLRSASTYTFRVVSFDNPNAKFNTNSVGLPTVGVWYTGCAVVASTSSRTTAYNGNAFGTANTDTQAVSAQDRYGVGIAAYNGGTADNNFDGDIADVAFYNIALAQDDYDRYHRGESPLTIHPEALTAYFPYFLGGKNPLHSQNNNIYLLNSGAQQVEFRSQGTGGVASWSAPTVLVGRNRIFVGAAGGTAYTLTAAQATFTETGNAANLLKGSVILTATGAFTETGNAANLVKTSVLATEVGAFTETGNAVNLTKQWALVADVASFVLTGNDATLDYSGDTHPPLVAASGSYTLTGNAAGLAHGYVLTTEVGTFTETGNDVTLKVGNALVTEVGAFVLTGNDSTLTKASVLSLEKGTFIMTGRNANLIWSGAGGSTVEFFRGVSKAPDGGVSKTIHTLVDGGGGTYVVTESSGVSEDKTDSPNYEGYIIT